MTSQTTEIKQPIIATSICGILHPVMIPLYVMVILLFGDSYINTPNVAITTKLIIITITALMTTVAPLYSATILTKFLTERKRNVFILVFTLFYFVTMLLLYIFIGRILSQKIFMTMAIVSSIANTLDYYKGISLHLVGISALLGFITTIHNTGYANILSITLLCIIASGLLFTSRLVLAKTTPLQGTISMLVGFGLTTLLLYI